ncbi:MAG: tetratricopeptide repeat protein [Bacteroidales bacterium]|jgi:tetratricopeptide (TPR) repeat protein|nr:tetratricopeptide repeat protein [Bacteroidales bacterium]
MVLNIKNILPYLLILNIIFISLPGDLQAQRADRKDKKNDRQDNTAIFLEANSEKLLGNLVKAKGLFLQCLELDPYDAASMYELARIERVNNNSGLALEWAEKAVQFAPENVWYLKLLSELYQENMEFEKSIEVSEKLVELHPENLEYLYDLALTHLLVGNYRKSIETYNRIENIIGITEEISLQKQKIWMRLDEPEKAIEEIEALCTAWPNEMRFKSILAELYLSNGKEDEALQIYLEISEKDPNNAYIQITLSDYYRKQGDTEKSLKYLKRGFANPYLDIDTKVQILLAYFTAEEYYEEQKEDAAELARILVETHPDNPRSYSILADIHYQNEEWKEARQALRKVVELDPSNYIVWEQLLFTESNLSDFEAMRKVSRQTIELFPQQPLPYLFAAVASYNFEDHEQMIRDLETGIQYVVRNDLLLAEFYNYLGDAYHQTGQDKKAFEAYEASLKIKPDNSIVLNNYAYYLSLRGEQLDRAKKMALKANELDPGNSSNQDTYGWVLYKLGEYEEALEWIGKSIENHKVDNAEVLEHYGDVLYKLGRTTEALEYWKRALKAGEGGSDLLEKKVNEGTLYE